MAPAAVAARKSSLENRMGILSWLSLWGNGPRHFASADASLVAPSREDVHASPCTGIWPEGLHGTAGAPPQGDLLTRAARRGARSEEHTSELQSRFDLVCRLLLEK